MVYPIRINCNTNTNNTPGSPKTPAMNALNGFSGTYICNPLPQKFINDMHAAPNIAFKNNRNTHFPGKTKILPKKYNATSPMPKRIIVSKPGICTLPP